MHHSSPSPSRRGGLKKHSSAGHRDLLPSTTSLELTGPLPNPSAASPALNTPDQPPSSRRSNSSSLQLNLSSSSSSQTPPGTWSVSGKLVRKKASGLFREAARSWGRSKSKEVIAFGLGLIGGNQDSSSTNCNTTTTTTTLNPPPPPTNNPSLQLSPSSQPQTPDKPLQPQPTPNPIPNSAAGIILKGPKKRISFHGPKKLKAKSTENSKLVKRRSEIGFGDWADTLNTAVASSSPQPSQPFPLDKANHSSDCSAVTHQPCPPLNHSTSLSHLSQYSPDPMAIPLRRRDRSFNLNHNLHGTPPVDAEPFSSAATSRVPRSTFPHAHRSPRSPRRFYNTRAAVQRNQSSLHAPPEPFFVLRTSTPPAHIANTGLEQYQQPAPLTSSPFKRSVSPINQFEDDFDLESPIASKSHGRAPPAADLQLRAARSARANLFGAMPNRSGGLEPASSSDSVSQSSTPQAVQHSYHLPLWSHTPSAHPLNSTASVPRSRQRTVSATLQEHSSRFQAQHLNTLSEDGCDSDPEGSKSVFGSPSSSVSRNQFQDFAPSHRSSSSVSQKTGPQNTRAHQVERWVMPRIEGLDMTPRRPSLDGSCDDSDSDGKAFQAGSSKSSSTTSILSCLTTQELRSRIKSGPSNSSLRTSLGAFDAFGALPPPESPFPGPPRFKRAGPAASPASPNRLKRDNDGELVGFASQPNLYRHRVNNAPAPTCSLPSLRFKSDPFESARPSHRDSWSQQSNCLSDDDEDGIGVVDHHDRDAINGSHESHEGTSNLSVPGLTDSSSLASSLVSSNQSSNIRPPVDGAALLSTTWDKSSQETGRESKRRSLPANVGRTPPHNFTPVPPIPTCLAPTPRTSKHDPLPLPSTLIRSTDSSFQDHESSFQSVKPNASVFLSSGMKSKTTVARSRREQTLDTSLALLRYAMLNTDDPNTSANASSDSISFEASIAAKSLREALGGPRVIMAAVREDEAYHSPNQTTDQSGSMHNVTRAANRSSDSPLGIDLPEILKKTSAASSSRKMPDTPIKKSFLQKSHPQVNKPIIPSGLSKQSNAYSPSINGSPIDNSPSSRCHQSLVPESPIPHFEPISKSNVPFSLFSKSPEPSSHSPYDSFHDDIDPSPSLNRSNIFGQIPACFDLLSKQSSPFRRRSSDGVLSTHSGQHNTPFDDADTPTKVSPAWLKLPQLMTSPSPGNSIYSANNSPSMRHHLQVDQLASGNCSLEHLVDPQVTPNRSGVRSYNHSIPASDCKQQGSPATFTPVLDHVASPAFANRYESPTMSDSQRRNREVCGISSPLGDRLENDFDIVSVLGCGEFGKVICVKQGGTLYAVKTARRHASGPKALERQYEEVDALKRLTNTSAGSPYIIQFVDAWQELNRWYIQTEFCNNRTLELFLEMIAGIQDHVDEERIWKITSELAQAVAFMHSCGVLHLDIKPANIFITTHGGLKVGDFGLARRWPRINPRDARECGLLNGRHKLYHHVPTNSVNQIPDSSIPSRFLRYEGVSDNEERHMMRFKSCGRFVGFDLEREGDREYIAPEILSGRYGEEADVFSVGLIALEISTNVVLPDNGDEWRGLRSSDFSRTDLSHLSSELVLLIKRMMDKCPDRRITADELVQHPVLSNLGSLRAVGLANERKDFMEAIKVLDVQRDSAGDTPMKPCDDQEKEKEPVVPLRPVPPPNNIWKSARGAVLPEAEGFLPFILTGQNSLPRDKPLTHSSSMIMSNDHYPKPEEFPTAEANDAMEIDV